MWVCELEAPGSTFGDVGVVFGTRQECTVEAITPSQCLILQKVDFDNLVKDFPDSLDKIHQNEKTRLEYDEDRETLDAIEKLYSLKSQQQIAQLSDAQFAAATGEVDVVRQALSEGKVDRHEMDPERRTFLHLAASAGQLIMAAHAPDAKPAAMRSGAPTVRRSAMASRKVSKRPKRDVA